MSKITISKAVSVGSFAVNGPVLLLMVVPFLVMVKFFPDNGYWGGAVLAASFVCAWLYWSLSVPLWRLWAYARVENIAALKKAAVRVGLIWPDGHFFERTEIKSAANAAKIKALEAGNI